VIARLESDVPLFGVIEPGALQATRETKNKKVGVIGTRATVRNRAYVEALNKLDPQIEVSQQACPLLVSLVEEGWDQDPLTNLIVYRYVNPLVQQGIDTLILGCTHYPVLRNAIHKVAGNTVQLVESGFTLTALIKKQFESGQILTAGAEHRPQHRILTTDNSETFESLTRRLLPAIECRPELIHI
jgi:glutamate racemase